MKRSKFGLLVALVALIAIVALGALPAGAAARTLDMKVLVVSSGNGTPVEADRLKLMTDLLDQVGTPYRVFNAGTEALTAGGLQSGDRGLYNGVILTDTELFNSAEAGNSAFNATEWATLHSYERDFDVRESVLSGFPAINPALGLDYGVDGARAIDGASDFDAAWQPPAGGSEVFEYVNTAQPLFIDDFAVRSYARNYAGLPTNDPTRPDLQPLLVVGEDASNPVQDRRTLVSVVRYSDGREVLLSTVANAWFLVHSQVLAYEFLNYATKGVFIGARKVYLAAHNDDLFLADTLWDPIRNLTDGSSEWRMAGADYNNAVASQNAFRASHPTASDFKLDFAFNGSGADIRRVAQPPVSLPAVADTSIHQVGPNRNFGTATTAGVQFRTGAVQRQRALLRFDVPVDSATPLSSANLKLFTTLGQTAPLPAQVCAVTAAWDEGPPQAVPGQAPLAAANWNQRQNGVPWSAQGGDYDASTCVPFTLADFETVRVDLTSIVAAWRRGDRPNHGLIVLTATDGQGGIRTREAPSLGRRPALELTLGDRLAATLSEPYRVPDAALPAAGDTFVRQGDPQQNFGSNVTASVRLRPNANADRALTYFALPGLLSPIQQASLDLYTEGDPIGASVCPATAEWDEGTGELNAGATWTQRKTGVPWSAPGGDYDAGRCVGFTFANAATVSVDVTDIVEAWQVGDIPNRGFVVVSTTAGQTQGRIRTRETGDAAQRPTLRLSFPTVTPDSLTAAVLANPGAFRYINHTLTHRDMDVSAGTTYDQARFEIEQNRAVWDLLGLPDRANNDRVLVSGDHSGLRDDQGTDEDPSDDQPYPGARNNEFLRAAQDAGVGYLASDSSQPNQNVESTVPGFNLRLLPRYPTAIFYNTTTPAQLTDEYNYIFYERFVNQGQDPCNIPGAICAPRTYQEILAAEADTAVRHMLGYKPWSHFFHQSNLQSYPGGGGRTLQFDWLNAVLDRYEQLIDLPVDNITFYDTATETEDRIGARQANVRGVIDLDTGQVSVSADANANALLTGVAGGETYGGQSQVKASVGTATRTFTIDRALDR